MRRILNFYRDINYPPFSSVDDILNKWDDYKLQSRTNYLDLFFPNKVSHALLSKFKKNTKIRRRLTEMVIRFINFLGYNVSYNEEQKEFNFTRNDKPFKREERGILVGFYGKDTFQKITRMFNFLNLVEMPMLSSMLYNVIVNAISRDEELKQKIYDTGLFRLWVKTQKDLKSNVNKIEEEVFGRELDDWEKSDPELENYERIEIVKDGWDD